MNLEVLVSAALQFLRRIHDYLISVIIMTVLISICPAYSFASAWNLKCKRAINNLKYSQEDVNKIYETFIRKKSDLETARFSYELCNPSGYAGCESEREKLDKVKHEYDEALKELENQLSDFDHIAFEFKRDCLSE